MLNFDRDRQTDLSSRESHRIRVIGVGGAGGNMLDRLKLNGIGELDLCVVNTDQRALQASVIDDRVQLGRSMTRGLGAGGDPEVGRGAAEASLEDLVERVDARDLVFLCGGLGGGTGSGALATIARLAREAGAFVVAFVTMPFSFEGRRRVNQGQAALDELNCHCHALMTFQNNRMSELVDPEDGIHSAFAKVDQLIASAVASIAGMVSRPGLIHLGLDDLIAALEDNRSDCLFGWGEARGPKRSKEVVEEVLRSPLLERDKLARQSRTVLVHLAGGQDLSLFEVEEVMGELAKQLHPNAHILFGTAVDADRESLQLTVISSLADAPYPDPEPEAETSSAASPEEEPPSVPVVEEVSPEHPETELGTSTESEPVPEPESEEPETVAEVGPADEAVAEPTPMPAAEEAPRAESEPVAESPGDSEEESGPEPEAEARLRTARPLPLLRRASGEPRDSVDPSAEGADKAQPPDSKAASAPKTAPARKEASAPDLFASGGESGRGRFSDSEPTVEDGEDLDLPTFLRRRK